MTKHFNLLDEPWIPVRFVTGEVCDVGLLELFARANDIATLAETSPPNLIAQYRLLLAITHRALLRTQGEWKDRNRATWYRNGLPAEALHDYLKHWRDRFWLFHPEHPFMQVAALATHNETRDKFKPWTQIALDSANGNTPVLFDHSVDLQPKEIAPALAVRHLLGFLQFTPGGLVKVVRSADKAGALANTAAVIPLGGTLNQTLCLSLHPWHRSATDDTTAWERDPVSIATLAGAPQLATGPDDRYTRLSRAVLFLADKSTATIRWIRFAAGIALADDANAPDPMANYRIGTNGPVRLTFTEGRAIWRDLSSLMPDPSGKDALPAAVLAWAANLKTALGEWDSEVPVLIAGLASDQAKLLRWRSERFALPAPLLTSADAGPILRQQVRHADENYFRLRGIATDMVASTMPSPANKDTRSRARAVVDAGPCAATYFSTAERALQCLMQLIAQGELDKADDVWRRTLAIAAATAWQTTFHSLGQSTAALRAEAMHHWKLVQLQRELRGDNSGTAPSQTSPTIFTEEARP